MLKPFMIIFCSLLCSKSFCQIKLYKLFDKTNSADINHRLVVMLDTAKPGMALMSSVFKPVGGKFNVYRFLAIYQGLSFNDKRKEFHDILMVKTDTKGKIIEAYQYTLEWAEPPAATDLYKSTCKHTYLTDSMEIGNFKFRRSWYYDKQDKWLKDSAHVKLCK